jgi:hypothetical protein
LVQQGLVVGGKEIAEYLCALAPAESKGPPELDTRRELWTRESSATEHARAAMRDELAREADVGADALESAGRRKAITVYAVIALVVMGLLGLVVARLVARGQKEPLPGKAQSHADLSEVAQRTI